MSEGRIWLAAELAAVMIREAADWFPLETGGMLVGYQARGSSADVVVCQLIGPGPGADHNATDFAADGQWQQEQLERAYYDSGRITTFVGDWHSHPRGAARPSRRDRRTARLVAADPEARCAQPVTVIVGLGSEVSIAGYQLFGRRLRRVPLVAYREASRDN